MEDPTGGMVERSKLPQWGLGHPQPTNDLVHFIIKIWHLVATILIIFLRINWSFPHVHRQRSCKLGERRSPGLKRKRNAVPSQFDHCL